MTTMRLSEDHSNQSVVIEAAPDEVWEAIVDDERRAAWLDDDRPIDVETVEEGRRLVWWWGTDEGGLSRVEVELAPCVSGTQVTVTESFPLTALITACTAIPA
jgi:uncharacterized protein YndB with AHSA1/START domain